MEFQIGKKLEKKNDYRIVAINKVDHDFIYLEWDIEPFYKVPKKEVFEHYNLIAK